MGLINRLFDFNYSLTCAFFAWGCAQFLKIIFLYIIERRLNFRLLFSSGGMPSAHSAAVTALAAAVGKELGLNSPGFSIAAIFAVIVMYDSSGVRQSSGQQAKLLNKIVEILDIKEIKQIELKNKLKIFNKFNKENVLNNCNQNDVKILKERLGHTVLEVLGGSLLGFFIVLITPF